MKYLKLYEDFEFEEDFEEVDPNGKFKIGDFIRPIGGFDVYGKCRVDCYSISSVTKYVPVINRTISIDSRYKRQIVDIHGEYFKHDYSTLYYKISEWEKIDRVHESFEFEEDFEEEEPLPTLPDRYTLRIGDWIKYRPDDKEYKIVDTYINRIGDNGIRQK